MIAPSRTIILASCALLALLLGFAGLFWYFHGKRYDVVITQNQIDDALRTKFPVTKRHLLIFQVTYSNPRVTLLQQSNRIEVGLDADLNIELNERPLGGTAIVTAGMSYRNETHQFFLSEPVITKLEIRGVPQKHLDKVTRFASDAAREYLQEFPVHTLKAKDVKSATAKLLLKDVQARGKEVHVTLGL